MLLKNQILGLALPPFLKCLASPYSSLDLDCFSNNTVRFWIMKWGKMTIDTPIYPAGKKLKDKSHFYSSSRVCPTNPSSCQGACLLNPLSHPHRGPTASPSSLRVSFPRGSYLLPCCLIREQIKGIFIWYMPWSNVCIPLEFICWHSNVQRWWY